MKFYIKKYNDLTLDNLYDLLSLRQSVFVVEQNCPYEDVDQKDKICFHLLGYKNKELIAYSRIFPPDSFYKESVSIGRIVVLKSYRKKGIGLSLINESLNFVESNFGKINIRIEAQSYLKEFYSKFGFKIISDEYLEDGIPHFSMILN
tara:strand:+ start:30 stop:473 length:444 start_codon:yes stop_codon:yes gene_type:complete